jgi:lipopolysaccharide transport system ATP-binding protein
MFVRLAFANAIHVDPDILIVDEALAVGDQLFQRKCYSFLEKFREQGKTLIFVSHSTLNINQLCNRALLIDGGEVLLDGTARLVTTQYERLLFSNPAFTQKIRNEIIQINASPEIKKKYQKDIDLSVAVQDGGMLGGGSTETEGSEYVQADFIKGLVPESTIEYKSYDVEIIDIAISTLDGRKVNRLVMNEKYIFSYKVKFNMAAAKVSFGMSLKTDKGLILGAGASYEIDKPIELVRLGEEYEVKWKFTCFLLPGTYFMDIGVSSMLKNNRVYLNRIVDASVFKVQATNSRGYYGFVTFNHHPTIEKVTN